MLKEWLPQLITAAFLMLFAVTGTAFLASSDKGQAETWDKWIGLVSDPPAHDENTTVKASPPPMKFIVWATSISWGSAGFYLAAGLAAFIHRSDASA